MENDKFLDLMTRTLAFLRENGALYGEDLMRIGVSLQMTALIHWPEDQRRQVVEWAKQQVDTSVLVMECGGTRQ